MKPWYNLLNKCRLSIIIGSILVLDSLISSIITVIQTLKGTLVNQTIKLTISWIDIFHIAFIIAIILLIISYLLDKCQLYLFPKVFFNLGKQKRELEKIQQLRNIIFIVIGAGIIVGVIASLIASLIMK